MTDPTMPRVRSVAIAHLVVTVLLAVVATYGCFLLINGIVGVVRGGEVLVGSLPVEARLTPDLVSLPPGLVLDGSLTARVRVEEPTSAQVALASAIDVMFAVFYVAFLWILRGIAGSLRHRQPFGEGTVRRLRAIAILLLAGAPILEGVATGLGVLAFRELPENLTTGLRPGGYDVPDGALLAGLIALVLAEVFALGVRLREDAEGTI